MTDKEGKTCYNCGNKNCNVYYSTVKKDCKRHYETYEYRDFDCVNHVQWNGEWWYQYGTYNAEVRLIAWYNIPELPKEVGNG